MGQSTPATSNLHISSSSTMYIQQVVVPLCLTHRQCQRRLFAPVGALPKHLQMMQILLARFNSSMDSSIESMSSLPETLSPPPESCASRESVNIRLSQRLSFSVADALQALPSLS